MEVIQELKEEELTKELTKELMFTNLLSLKSRYNCRINEPSQLESIKVLLEPKFALTTESYKLLDMPITN
jgi:hypothetical protein